MAHPGFCSLCRVTSWDKTDRVLKSREDGLELSVVSHRRLSGDTEPWSLLGSRRMLADMIQRAEEKLETPGGAQRLVPPC